MLSAIVITKNEEKNIRTCLDSLEGLAEEIIVVDSLSTDQTAEICRNYSQVKFYQFPDWQGFGVQKNRALAKASGEWVLSIDADEVISADLKKEIREIIDQLSSPEEDIQAYAFPRLSHLCKLPVKSCGWYPDYVLRLFKRKEAYFSENLVHERVILKKDTKNTKDTNQQNRQKSRIKKLKHHLIHYSYQQIEDLLSKTNLYSSASAQEKKNKNKRVSFSSIILRALFEFFRSYFLQRGLFDGRVGLIISFMKAEAVYYKYLKLYFLQLSD